MENYEIPVSLKNADVIINYVIYEEGYKCGCYVKGFNDVAANLKSITVEKGNNYFSSRDGVLFNLKMTKIYLYPRARKGKYIIPGTVKKMDDNTFAGAKVKTETDGNGALIKVTGDGRLVYYPVLKKGKFFKVPGTVKSIGSYAFKDNKYLEKSYIK